MVDDAWWWLIRMVDEEWFIPLRSMATPLWICATDSLTSWAVMNLQCAQVARFDIKQTIIKQHTVNTREFHNQFQEFQINQTASNILKPVQSGAQPSSSMLNQHAFATTCTGGNSSCYLAAFDLWESYVIHMGGTSDQKISWESEPEWATQRIKVLGPMLG